VLLLAWKMGAQRMGYFTRGEFEGGARALKAADAKSMKKAALGLEDEVAAPAPLLAFATFAFKYCLTVRSCLFFTHCRAAGDRFLLLPGSTLLAGMSSKSRKQLDVCAGAATHCARRPKY